VKEGTFYIIYEEYDHLPLEISRLYRYFLAHAEHVFLLKLQYSIGIFRAMQNT
jgi:hypothetical protein